MNKLFRFPLSELQLALAYVNGYYATRFTCAF